MKYHYLLFLTAAVAPLFTLASEIPEEKNVLVLDDDNFDDAVKENDLLLVEFYAPWCGHCKRLEPEYATAAGKLKEKDIRIAKVDATENRDLASRFGVRGFPTLKLFRGDPDNAADYEGGRTSSEIVKYMIKKSGPVASELKSKDDVEKLKSENDIFVAGFFDDAKSDAATVFLSLAARMDDVVFAAAYSKDVADAYSVSSGSVILFKTFDEGRVDTTIDASAPDAIETLLTFVAGNQLPLITEFSQETAPKIFGGPVKTHLIVFDDLARAEYAALKSDLTSLAAENKGTLQFVIVPATEKRVAAFFGVEAPDKPLAVIADMSGEGSTKKYMMAEGEEATKDSVTAFVQSFKAGELKPHLKSEDPEEDDLEQDVVVLRGKTFQEAVIDNDKDVLVEFYAPWCGHCKKLAPIFDELGEKFSDVDGVRIAKMDSTANEIDVEGVTVRGFPTIYFFPGGNKAEPVAYEGGRDLKGFMDYLRENASNQFTVDGVKGGGEASGKDEL